MQPREHLIAFAKRTLPAAVFQAPERLFAELTGDRREALLLLLWTEAGKQVERPLPPAEQVKGVDGVPRLVKLAVVGAARPVGHEIVVISMPPAIHVNEVLFVALVRRATGVSVFFHQRCIGPDHTTVAANEAVLLEVRADGSRLNHGFKNGIDLEAFKVHIGGVLGVSLAGLETSLPPSASAGAVAAPVVGGTGARLGRALVIACGVAAVGPLTLHVPGLATLMWPLWRAVGGLLSLAIGVGLVVWIRQLHVVRRGQTKVDPELARIPVLSLVVLLAPELLGWFGFRILGGGGIPWFDWLYAATLVIDLVLVPVVVHSAWRAVVGAGGAGLVAVWWVFFVLAALLRNIGLVLAVGEGVITVDSLNVLFRLGFVLPLVGYGLLFYIVRSMTAKL